MIVRSDSIGKILLALSKVKSEIEGVAKKSENPYYHSNYADLNTHLDTVEPVAEKHGLMILQPTSVVDGKNVVHTIIFHIESGQFIEASLTIEKVIEPQKVAIAITYFRRITLNTLLALKSLDDDGEGVTDRPKNKTFKKKKKFNTNDEF